MSTYEAFAIGALAGLCCYLSMVGAGRYLHKYLDDPCAAFAVHGAAGVWGLLAVGIFASEDPRIEGGVGTKGILHGAYSTRQMSILWQFRLLENGYQYAFLIILRYKIHN